MEYSIRQLAQLTGLSTRTLRYYDEIGLLHPSRVSESGYRFYGQKEIALLQQILFYRERGLALETIRQIINRPDFDVQQALEEHLAALFRQQEHLSALIQTVKFTLADLKGEYQMEDKMKFEALKQKLVQDNEERYGEEIRSKYGDETVEQSNRKLLNLSEEEYRRFQQLEGEICSQLEKAVADGLDPQGETGRDITRLHRQWLGYTWKDYSPQAHVGLAQMYLADERFRQYYDRSIAGCTEFLAAAVSCWADK